MSDNPDLRTVSLERTEKAGYVIRNTRGGEVVVGTAEGDRFTPVELFLGALAACGAVDLDLITSKRAEPERMRARSTPSRSATSSATGSSISPSPSTSRFRTPRPATRPAPSSRERSSRSSNGCAP